MACTAPQLDVHSLSVTCSVPVSPPGSLVSKAVTSALADPAAVRIVRMAPGQGKSTQAQQELVNRLLAGEVRRVLWAVRETKAQTSLGRQALAAFTGTTIQCDLVLGAQASASPAAYRAALKWPEGPCIKIISHAHLPLLMDPGLGPATLADADLLLIDEDPSSSLLEQHTFHLESLARHQTVGDRITAYLVDCAAMDTVRAQGGAPHEYRSFDKRKGADIWSGETFWAALRTQLGPLSSADIDAFMATLASLPTPHLTGLRQPQLEVIRAALTEDSAAAHPSGRFALSWSDQGVTLDVHVRIPWQLDLPAVVLDAYAAPEKYVPLFQERRVEVLDSGDPVRPPHLHSTHRALPQLDATNFRNGRQPHLLRRYFQEVHAYRQAQPSPRRTLLVAHKEIIEHPTFRALGETFFGSEWGTTVETQHWHAGRGNNDFKGYDIFALTRPVLSKRHRDFTLAALAPHDAALRERLHQLDGESEFLQTMHRNRQGHFLAADAPLNVLFWDHSGAQAYPLHLHHTRGSSNPDWRDHAYAVLVAFRDHLGGLPHAALHLAGLVRPEAGRSLKTPPALEQGILKALDAMGFAEAFPQPMSERGAKKALVSLLIDLGLTDTVIAPAGAAQGQSRMKYYVQAGAGSLKEAAQSVEAALRVQGIPAGVLFQAECAAPVTPREAASSGAASRMATSAAKASDQHADSGGPS